MYEMAIMVSMPRKTVADYGHYGCKYLWGKRVDVLFGKVGLLLAFRRIHGSPTLSDHRILKPTFLDHPHFSQGKEIVK